MKLPRICLGNALWLSDEPDLAPEMHHLEAVTILYLRSFSASGAKGCKTTFDTGRAVPQLANAARRTFRMDKT